MPSASSSSNGSEWTISSVREALTAKRISARELASDFLARIEKRNPSSNAFLALSPERALAQADRVDALVARKEPLPPLAGLPLAVKDVLSTHGVPTTCSSRILEGYRPAYDATAIERLEQSGAMMLGKTNCDEFAMGGSNENSAYGPVRNPVALDRVPGGSSGGSAAASGRRSGRGRARDRHGGVDSPAGRVLRHSRNDADVRARLALRTDRFRLFAGPHWSIRAERP